MGFPIRIDWLCLFCPSAGATSVALARLSGMQPGAPRASRLSGEQPQTRLLIATGLSCCSAVQPTNEAALLWAAARGSEKQIFGTDEQVRGLGPSDKRAFRPGRCGKEVSPTSVLPHAERRAEFKFLIRSAN